MYFKTLNYTSGRFEVEGYKFSNDFVKRQFPKYAFDDNIKIVYYQEASGRNCIIYKDGTKKDIGDYDKFYNELLLDSYAIYIEYRNKQEAKRHQKIQEHAQAVALVRPVNLFKAGLTEAEQDELIARAKKLKPHIVVDKDYFYNALAGIKLRLLKASDFTQLPDVQATYSEEQKAAWIKYRAALRNLDKTDDPKSVRLPVIPEDIG